MSREHKEKTKQVDIPLNQPYFPILSEDGTPFLYVESEIQSEGGIGVIRRGYNPETKQYVAIKALNIEDTSGVRATITELIGSIAAYTSEGSGLALSAITYIDSLVPEIGKRHFLVMDWVEVGQDSVLTLYDFLETEQLSPDDVTYVLAQVARFIETYEAKGWLHLDLKPSNIFIDVKTLEVKIFDYNVSQKMETIDDVKAIPYPEDSIGTLIYSSPERMRWFLGMADLKSKSDLVTIQSEVFSVATIAFKLLTGRDLFDIASVMDLINVVRNYDQFPDETARFFRESMRKNFPHLSDPQIEQCLAVFNTALSQDYTQRQASPAYFVHDLDLALKGKLDHPQLAA